MNSMGKAVDQGMIEAPPETEPENAAASDAVEPATPDATPTPERRGPGCLWAVYFLTYFFIAGTVMYFPGVLIALIAIPFLLLSHLAHHFGILPGKWAARNCRLAVFCSLFVPVFYHLYKGALERFLVIPTREYDSWQESRIRSSKEFYRRELDKGLKADPEYLRSQEEVIHSYLRETNAVDLGEESTFVLTNNHPRLDGATSLAGIYRSFAKAAYRGTGGLMRVRCSRTPHAYEDLIDGRADIIFVFRPSDNQIRKAAEKGLSFHITPIGYDAFVFFVNENNPVRGLTSRQLRDIYGGKLTNWRGLGGDRLTIIPFQRPEESGSQSRMLRFMEGHALLPAEDEILFQTMIDIVHTARYHNYRGAIGYSFLYFVDQMVLDKGVRLLEVDGAPPTLATIRDGSYPLREEICAVTAGTDNPNAKPFIEWMLSPQGQAIIEKVGYIPIRPRAEKDDVD